MEPLRIGVLGAAKITKGALVGPAASSTNAVVAAVAARDQSRAQEWAQKHGVKRVLPDYGAVVDDPDIDAVYIPLPNGLHGKWTLASIKAGKPVLCEKPFTANADEARTVAEAADTAGVIVMEAFHYRHHPMAARLKAIVDSGELGEISRIESSLCFPLPRFGDIRYNLALAGGALMDAGCYPTNLARFLAGREPNVTSARALTHGEGIDRAMRVELDFSGGLSGEVRCSMWSKDILSMSARVVGENGEVRAFNPFSPQMWHRITVRSKAGRRVEHVTRRPTYSFQLDAFVNAVRNGGPIITDTVDAIANMVVIDAAYEAAGLGRRRPTP
jgi:predicted dehydrogenase